MKRSLLLIMLCLVVIGGFLMSGCAKTTATPSTTTTAPKPTTTAPVPTTTTTAPKPATTTTAPTTTTAAVQPYGTIRIASPSQSGFTYESMDPNFWETFWGWAVYDPLVTFDNQGNVIGVVADSWTISPDGKTFTFKIHQGIKFSNGDPLTAADVKFSVTGLLRMTPPTPLPPTRGRRI